MSDAQFTAEQQVAELVDEIVYIQKQSDQWAACCEALVGYVALLEQHVLLPAFGNLVTLLNEFHSAAESRARGESLISSTVNAANHPQLARLFNLIAKPQATTLHEAKRQQILSGPAPLNLDDTYAGMVAMANSLQELQQLIRDSRNQAAVAASVGSQSNSVVADLERTIASLRLRVKELETTQSVQYTGSPADSVDQLRKQIALSEQRNASSAQLAKQETDLLAAKLTSSQQQLRDVERELEETRSKLRAAQQSESLYQQASAERKLLSERVKALEDQVRLNEADRAAVAESFEVLQAALEASGNPLALQQAASIHGHRTSTLEQEVKALREATAAHKVELEGITQKHDRIVADLRKKLIHAQQLAQKSSGGAAASILGLLSNDGGTSHIQNDSKVIFQQLPAQSFVQPSGDVPKAKLKAFEMTVAALNAELAQLEEKILSMETRYADEREQLQRKMDAEREKFELEQSECDSVLATLSVELEQCMKENADLRNRLQAQYAGALR